MYTMITLIHKILIIEIKLLDIIINDNTKRLISYILLF